MAELEVEEPAFQTLSAYKKHYALNEHEKECGGGGNCFYFCLAAAQQGHETWQLPRCEAHWRMYQHLQSIMRARIADWLSERASTPWRNGLTLFENLDTGFVSRLLDDNNCKHQLMEGLTDDLAYPDTAAAFWASLQHSGRDTDNRDPDHLKHLSGLCHGVMQAAQQVLRVPLNNPVFNVRVRQLATALLQPPNGQVPSWYIPPGSQLQQQVWEVFLDSVQCEREWNYELCLIAASGVLNRPLHVMKVNCRGELEMNKPHVFFVPGSTDKQPLHLLHINSVHWRIMPEAQQHGRFRQGAGSSSGYYPRSSSAASTSGLQVPSLPANASNAQPCVSWLAPNMNPSAAGSSCGQPARARPSPGPVTRAPSGRGGSARVAGGSSSIKETVPAAATAAAAANATGGSQVGAKRSMPDQAAAGEPEAAAEPLAQKRRTGDTPCPSAAACCSCSQAISASSRPCCVCGAMHHKPLCTLALNPREFACVSCWEKIKGDDASALRQGQQAGKQQQ